MTSFGPHRIYVCGRNAYDNELALARHEGVQRLSMSSVTPTIDSRPRFAYRIADGETVRWATDPVEAYRARAASPTAVVDVVAVRR